MSTAETASIPQSEPQSGRSSNPPRNRRPRGERNPNPSTQPDEPQSDASNSGRRRRGGGGRGRGARDPLLALRPSSVAPSTQPSSIDPSSADVSGTEATNARNQDSRRGRGGARGGRGGARGGRTREYRPMLPPSSLDTPSLLKALHHSKHNLVRKDADFPNLQLPTLPLVLITILTTATTNVPSAQAKFFATPKSGHATLAGPSSTCLA
jgi:hypothetical protein